MKEFRHENIVQMRDAYLVDSELWVAMEYLDGGALNDIVTNARCVCGVCVCMEVSPIRLPPAAHVVIYIDALTHAQMHMPQGPS